MSEKQSERIRPSQVAASALAAVTAAVLGSTMSVAGTVIGAGLASIVTTVGGVLYLRSFERTKQGVRQVRTKAVTRAGPTTLTVTEQAPPATANPAGRTGWPRGAGQSPAAHPGVPHGNPVSGRPPTYGLTRSASGWTPARAPGRPPAPGWPNHDADRVSGQLPVDDQDLAPASGQLPTPDPDRTHLPGQSPGDPDRTQLFRPDRDGTGSAGDPDRTQLFRPDRDGTGSAGDPDRTRLFRHDPDGTGSPGDPDRTQLFRHDPDGTRSPGDPDRTHLLGRDPDGTRLLGQPPADPDRTHLLGRGPAEDPHPDHSDQRKRPRWRTWSMIAVGSLVAFVVGMGVITGVEWLRGEPLSGGDGTTLGEIIKPRPADERDQTPPPVTTTPPTSDAEQEPGAPTDAETTDQAPEPTGETPTDPPTGSTTPPSDAPTTSDTPSAPGSSPPSGP